MVTRHVGIDFGTTNSALAVADGARAVRLAEFDHAGGRTSTFRSVVYFDPHEKDAAGRTLVVTGPRAIDAYLRGRGEGRLIQSAKSFLTSRTFASTQIFGRTYKLEDLLALILRGLRSGAEQAFGPLGTVAVVGRPVQFVREEGDAAADDEALALSRLRAAFVAAGFTDVIFEFEPVAAAYWYESTLDHDELVLIADFGGGTSDFCLMRVGPSVRRRGRTAADILGTEGVGLAGDAFDSDLVDHVVAPSLGKGSLYQAHMSANVMPVPPWLYSRLRRWHHLSFLKSKETMKLLEELHETAREPDKIDALIYVVESDLGYQLYREVERTKVALSGGASSVFRFDDAPVRLEHTVARGDFEGWIARHLHEVEGCVDRLLAAAHVGRGDVDRVFLTGGSSFVPAVRRIFEARFGEARLRSGDELTSVAMGLALRAHDAHG